MLIKTLDDCILRQRVIIYCRQCSIFHPRQVLTLRDSLWTKLDKRIKGLFNFSMDTFNDVPNFATAKGELFPLFDHICRNIICHQIFIDISFSFLLDIKYLCSIFLLIVVAISVTFRYWNLVNKVVTKMRLGEDKVRVENIVLQ